MCSSACILTPRRPRRRRCIYVGYQLSSHLLFAARVEYLADIGGLFSGTTQYLKEATLTLDYRSIGRLSGTW